MNTHGPTKHLVLRFLCLTALAAVLFLAGTACNKKREPPPPSNAGASGQPGGAQYTPAGSRPGEEPAPAVSEARKQYEEGLALKDQKKYAEAMEKFSLAIRADEKCGPAFLNRGICRSEIGQKEDALKDFTRAEELPPGDSAAPFMKAATLFELKRFDEAEKDFIALAARFPDEAPGHYYLGVFAEKRRNLPEALEHVNTALEKDPSLEPALSERACLYAIFEDFDKAFADIKRLRETNDNYQSRYLYAVVHLLRGRMLMDQSNAEKNPALADRAFEDFKEAETALQETRDQDAVLAIIYAETIASQSTADTPLYDTAAVNFQEILSDVQSQISRGENARLRVYLPRLQRDLAVTDIARGDEKKAVERLTNIIAFPQDFQTLWEQEDVFLIDRWLAFRVICDAMQSLAKICVSSQNDYASAETYLKQLLDFQTFVKADYGNAAAIRQRERETVQEAIYECEFQKIVPAQSAQYTYGQCLEFLAHPYYKIRAAGLVCLSQGNDPRCNDRIVEALDDADERVAAIAAQMTGEKKIKDAVPKLAGVIERRGPDAALAAVAAVGKLLENSAASDGNLIISDETRAAIPALIRALENGDARVREAAIESLKGITGRTQMYHHDDPPEVRAQAVERWGKWWEEALAAAPKNENPRPGNEATP